MNSLSFRVMRAGAWVVAGHGASQAIRLASNLIMTRLLVPEMFGVMAIAYVFMTGLAMVSDAGIAQNIVQNRRSDQQVFLRTAWAVQILRGAAIFTTALAISIALHLSAAWQLLPAGTVYADPMLPLVVAALALTGLISGFESTRLALAKRDLNLFRVAMIEVAGPAVSMITMLLWASFDRSIWALVSGGLAGALTRTILSHYVLPGISDRWGWDHASLAEIVGFGKWIFLSSMLGFLVINGDRLLLGGLVEPEVLGVYSIAVTLVAAIDAVLIKLSGDVALPALSEVARERPEQLRAVFYRFHRLVGGIALFSAGTLLTFGPSLIDILYDDRYRDAGWMIGIVGMGLAIAPCRIGTQCFIAMGQTRLISVLTFVRLPLLYLLTPVAFHFAGLHGALLAIAASALTCLPITWLYQSSAGLLDPKKEVLIWLGMPAGLCFGYAATLVAEAFLGHSGT